MGDDRHPIWKWIEAGGPFPPCDRLLGCEIVVAEPGIVHSAFEAKPDFANPMGKIQGGFLSAMLDATMSQTLATTLRSDEEISTLEMKVSFLRPASPGRLMGKGTVTHRGNSIAFVEGGLYDADDDLVAASTATIKIVRRR